MEPEALLGRTLVLVAHPDDECVICGGLLQRMADPLVLFCTDGAPHDPYFWNRYGSREAYGELREREAQHALEAVGVQNFEYLHRSDDSRFTDQELFRNLDAASGALFGVVRRFRPDAVLTLSYEGGHPDHDTCSFLAWLLHRELGIEVWETPAYHRTVDGAMVKQEFLNSAGDEIQLQLTPEELARKKTMWTAYESQSFVQVFDPEVERFRRQPKYDYSRPPHPGVLNYEAWQWRMTGPEVAAEFSRFLERRGWERREASAD
jgi:N-acetylglucosamine malate deacetylase 2